MDNAGNRYPNMYSCYATGKNELTSEGHLLKIQVDLGESYFQHAILLVQAIFDSFYHK